MRARVRCSRWPQPSIIGDRAIKCLHLARLASNADFQIRFMAIALHYLDLAQVAERDVERVDVARRTSRTGPR